MKVRIGHAPPTVQIGPTLNNSRILDSEYDSDPTVQDERFHVVSNGSISSESNCIAYSDRSGDSGKNFL